MEKEKYPKTKEIEQKYSFQEYYRIPYKEMDEVVKDTFKTAENVRHIRIVYEIKDAEGKKHFVSDTFTEPGFELLEDYDMTIKEKMDEKLSLIPTDSAIEKYTVVNAWMNVIYDLF